MNRLAVLAALTVALSTPALAQHPQHKPAAAGSDLAARLAGAWEGTFSTDHSPDGSIRIVFSKDGGLKATMELSMASGSVPTGPAADVKVADKDAAWTQQVMGQTCGITAWLEGTTLKGESQCGHGGMKFSATRKP